ncbi:MAG: lysophospholipase [Nannocystaceae bacterium]|nr:lysophospholipase [Nannocystaceae bacterium]
MARVIAPPQTRPPVEPPADAQWLALDGLRLYVSITGPRAGAVVWFVLGPEAGATPPYPRLRTALHEAGIATALLHPRGAGFSEGPRGDLDDFAALLADQTRFLALLATSFSRIVVLGHSVGAALALALAAEVGTDLAACVLVNPAWKLRAIPGATPSVGDMVHFAVDWLVRPRARTVDMNRNPAALTFAPDREEGEAMQRDPVVVRHFSLRFLAAQRRLMNRCAQHLARVRVPVLLVQGRHDALVDPGAYPQLIAAASQTTAQHVVAPEGGHGASAVETMVAPLVAWIDARVRG